MSAETREVKENVSRFTPIDLSVTDWPVPENVSGVLACVTAGTIQCVDAMGNVWPMVMIAGQRERIAPKYFRKVGTTGTYQYHT